MSTDRDDALRRAEALLRQGQLDPAIAEYVRLIETTPNDLVLLNTLGDLFVRTGVSERAVPLYLRVADAHMAEGFYARAAGYYKKILKFRPNDEDLMLRLAEASVRQGLRADARKYLQVVANARHRRRDTEGLVPVPERLDDLDPADLPTRIAAVRALVPIQRRGALDRLTRLATVVEERGQVDDALSLWREARQVDPSAIAPAIRLARAAVASGAPSDVVALLEGIALDDLEGVTLLAEAHLARGDRASARAILDGHVGRHPGADDRLGDLYARLGASRPSAPLPVPAAVPPPALQPEITLTTLEVEETRVVEPVLAFVEEAPVVGAIEVDPLLDEEAEDSRHDAALVEVLDVLPLADDEAGIVPVVAAPAPRVMVEVEVDLTDRLESAARELAPLRDAAPGPAARPRAGAPDFLGLGRTYLAARLHEQAVEAFAAASRDAAHAYEASAALAELYETRGEAMSAVPWLELAAASAPSPASHGAVLYRLGVTLERLGDTARALAVLRELKAMAPAFRDVAARVARLEAARPGGGSSSR